MARRNVITVEMMKYKRSPPKSPFLGWGTVATRKLTTIATSPVLLKYRSCIQAGMAGSKGTPKDIQEKFRELAHKCKAEAEKLKVAKVV